MSEGKGTGRSAATGRNKSVTGISAAFTGRSKAYTGSHEAPAAPKEKKPRRERPVKKKLQKAPCSKRTIYISGMVLAAVLIIVMALVLKSGAIEKSYSRFYSKGYELYEQEDYDGALAYLRKASSRDKTVECAVLMSRCYEKLGNIDKALELLRKMDTTNAEIAARINELETLRREIQDAELIEIAGKRYQPDSTGLVLDDAGLTNADLENVTRLRALSSLSLADNAISDISALRELGGLTTLNLSGNKIRDISALTGLTGLRTLYLDSNGIKDLTPLYGLKSLTLLSVKGVSMTPEQLLELSEALPGCTIYSEGEPGSAMDISIGGVTFCSEVRELDLSGRGLNDISALSACSKLEKLNISDNSISDLSPLMDQQSLRELDITGNIVSDLRPLMGLGSLELIHAGSNVISSTVALGALTQLRELTLDSNKISDISGLLKLRSLEELSLRDSGIDDDTVTALSAVKSLRWLNIENNPGVCGETVDAFRDALPGCSVKHSTLVYLVELGGKQFREDITELNASGLELVSISALGEFDALERVDLSDNKISNIYIFEWIKGVKYLNLSRNRISDLNPLLNMDGLEVLNLSENDIGDVRILSRLTWLKELYIAGNGLSAEQVEELRSALPNTTIYAD